MIKISVVIGTYNQKDTLKKVLESLFKQILIPQLYEIVVVDSFSTDGTDALIESLAPSPCSLNYIRQENRGKPAARNRGIEEAQGEIIFLTDADMVADIHLLQEHLRAHDKYENAAFEGQTVNPDGKPYIKEKLRSGQKLKWSYFLSGNLSAKKKTLIEAGLFDKNFTGYGWEDIELGYRLHQMKIPLYYLPQAVNYHNHPVSEEDLLKRKHEMGKSAAHFYKKHPNLEIKYFLGMNPLAMGIYNLIKAQPRLKKYVEDQAPHSPFYNYLLSEYLYREGLMEGLA